MGPVHRFAAILAIVLVLTARIASAQPVEVPSPSPAPVELPPAGLIPASVSIDVTGSPATDADVLDVQIRAALTRRIRPTLRPGAAIAYGPIVPWPLLPLATGSSMAVNVTTTIDADAGAPVTGVTTVNIFNVPLPSDKPRVLFLSDDPEYFQTEGVVFRGDVAAGRPARLYYYHSDIGLPRDLDVVLSSTVRARVQLIASAAGPDLDVMSVGHTVSRDILRFEQADEGIVVEVEPGAPVVVRHGLLLQGEVVAGAVDVRVVSGGPVTVSVLASPAGSRPDALLAGPRVPFDGHRRHGTFDLDGFGSSPSRTRSAAPTWRRSTADGRRPFATWTRTTPGRDFGDYGALHQIAFTLVNPGDAPQSVYLYEKPLGGPVRSSFVIDGQLKEVGCARLSQPYWVTTYQLPPHFTGVSTIVTMTDGWLVLSARAGRDHDAAADLHPARRLTGRLLPQPAAVRRSDAAAQHTERRWCGTRTAPSAAGDGSDDEQRLGARRDRGGQRRVRRVVGQILLAGEEPHERPALLRDVIADRAAQHRIAGLERVEHRALRRPAVDVELHLAVDARASVRRWAGSTTRIMAGSALRRRARPEGRGRSAPNCRRRRARRRPGRRSCRSRCRTSRASRRPSRRAARSHSSRAAAGRW